MNDVLGAKTCSFWGDACFPDRPAGFEAWSNRDFEGVSVGARNCAQYPIQNLPFAPEDTLDVMARARVGEGDFS